jgi:transcriptional regulator with XRE-family HTH domain
MYRYYLKKLRKKLRYSQREVAEKLEIGQTAYSNIESGIRGANLKLNYVIKLAELFCVTPEWILKQEILLQSPAVKNQTNANEVIT